LATFSGLCFAVALAAITAESKRSAIAYSTSLLDLILFNPRSLRVLSLGIREFSDLLFLLHIAIFERHQNKLQINGIFASDAVRE
jgi:hypothetical protein